MPSNKVAWAEGEELAEEIIFTLADKIVTAVLPDSVVNRWEKVIESNADMWVTYTKNTRNNIQGKYKHTDGKTYNVLKLIAPPGDYVDPDGFVIETTGTSANLPSGKKVDVNDVTIDGEPHLIGGLLVAVVDDETAPSGKKVYALKQAKVPAGGTIPVIDPNWNEFVIAVEMGEGWDYILTLPGYSMRYNTYVQNFESIERRWIAAALYTFTENYYTADVTRTADNFVVLKSTPDVPEGVTEKDFYVMLKQPIGQFNYFDVYQGEGFVGQVASGNPVLTYDAACDITTVNPGMTPTVTNQKEAEKQYLLNLDPESLTKYTPPQATWAMDGAIPVVSPPAHFFFGADSIVTWLSNKKRRADYWVGYWLSVNNNRAALVIEGDPAPDMDAYYRSFGYIGKIVPFANYDHTGNFGVTVGMGELTSNRTGFTANNIKPDTNPTLYAGYGRYTSNGMTSMSMLRTRSSVMFQAYYPAFITQLPNYKGVGTIPPELSTLVLEKSGYQASAWTDKYHASPIYMVHQYEGYRGYMDGVVAINDHNLINLDELVVDTEEWKNPADHSQGTWTEVYKFFSIKSPVSFLKSSANPDESSVAILKEIR